ncbi:MAG: efflux RND transporter periplasmic adaptor subunit [Phycisphaerae bacterium]|nr:efflux RND transporter periplasmic adaptor subunit [Phycisphaerae bacterium]
MFSRATGVAFRFGIPLIALGMLSFATISVVRARTPRPEFDPPYAPAENKFARSVAATGIVEPSSENILIGSQKSGVVRKVFVKVGDRVATDAPLFQLEDREARAALAVREQRLIVAREQLRELEKYPRPEEIPPAEARLAAARAGIAEAEANLGDQRRQLRFYEDAGKVRAATADEIERFRFAVQMAEARLNESKSRTAEAEAALALLKAGAFEPRVAAARAEVLQAEAEVDDVRAALDLLQVRAPRDGVVLQINVRAGEYAQAGMLATPLMIMGQVEPLHIRADVDETDAVRVRAGAPARAYIRGDATYNAPIEFVRFEPYVIPKRSLTGGVGERVDTRVLQVIYRLDPKLLPVFVGQQVDVYISEELDKQPASGPIAPA